MMNLSVLFCGSAWLYLVLTSSVSPILSSSSAEPDLLLGCVLVGIGVSTLFSSGVLWLILLVSRHYYSEMAKNMHTAVVGK